MMSNELKLIDLFPTEGCGACVFHEYKTCKAFHALCSQINRCQECADLFKMLKYDTDGVCAVQGESMLPTLHPYDIVIYRPHPPTASLPISDNEIVILKPPYQDKEVIKRVYISMIDEAGKLWYYVLGDNSSNSMDSRNYGYVPAECIVGKVYKTIRPDESMRRAEYGKRD